MQINIEHGLDKVEGFLSKYEAYLRQETAKNNLMLGILYVAKTSDKFKDIILVSVTDGGEVKLLAVQTPPKGFVINDNAHKDAVELFIKTIEEKKMEVPSFMTRVDMMPHLLEQASGEFKELNSFMIYSVDSVKMPQGVKGNITPITEENLELATKWKYDFTIEALQDVEHKTMEEAKDDIQKYIDKGGAFFWEVDGKPVSYITCNDLGYMGRIANVYTPQEFRKNGYASAMTATISQRFLDEGADCCALFADAYYSASNKVYQSIGYEKVTDSCVYIKK